jgi:hypothetical protein
MASSSKKNVGIKGKVLHTQAREIIANVIKFMQEVDGPKIPLKNVREWVLAATGISKKSYLQINKRHRNKIFYPK